MLARTPYQHAGNNVFLTCRQLASEHHALHDVLNSGLQVEFRGIVRAPAVRTEAFLVFLCKYSHWHAEHGSKLFTQFFIFPPQGRKTLPCLTRVAEGFAPALSRGRSEKVRPAAFSFAAQRLQRKHALNERHARSRIRRIFLVGLHEGKEGAAPCFRKVRSHLFQMTPPLTCNISAGVTGLVGTSASAVAVAVQRMNAATRDTCTLPSPCHSFRRSGSAGPERRRRTGVPQEGKKIAELQTHVAIVNAPRKFPARDAVAKLFHARIQLFENVLVQIACLGKGKLRHKKTDA